MALPREFRRTRIALVGFGDVAKRLVLQRLSQGHTRHGPRFIAISRSSLHAQKILSEQFVQSRSQWQQWDIDQTPIANRLARIAEMAIMFAPPPDTNTARDARSRRLAAAIRRAGKRIPVTYFSTTGVYGDKNGGVVSETSVCTARQARSLRRLDAERCLRPLGAHVLRVPGIYAEDRLPLTRLKAQTPALRQEEDVYTNHIHADDLACIAWLSVFRGRPARVTNAVDESEMKMGDYFDAVAQAHGLPKPPRVSLEQMKQLMQQGLISPMALSFFVESRRVISKRLEPELRARLQHPTVASCLHALATQPR